MAVLMFLGKVGDHLAHDVEQVVLEILNIEGVDIVGALLDHHGAGGVVGDDGADAIFDARLLDDLHHFAGNVVKGGIQPRDCNSISFCTTLKSICFPSLFSWSVYALAARSSHARRTAEIISSTIAARSAALATPEEEPVASAPAMMVL